MFFSFQRIVLALALHFIAFTAVLAEDAITIINGTQLTTKTDYDRDVVIFSNKCGTQTMSRKNLLQGAIPSDIVPCPRSDQSTQTLTPYVPDNGTKWGAVAVGVSGVRVASGYALGRSSKEEAREDALANCLKSGIASCTVQGTFDGCGYVSVSARGSDPSWGLGPTANEAYDACYSRVVTGDCRPAIGGCN